MTIISMCSEPAKAYPEMVLILQMFQEEVKRFSAPKRNVMSKSNVVFVCWDLSWYCAAFNRDEKESPCRGSGNRDRVCKRLKRPGIESKVSIPTVWESIPGLLKRFATSGSEWLYLPNGIDSQRRARVYWPLICSCRLFYIVERCLDSNPESCHSKQARYQLSPPSPYLATHLPG